MLLKSVHQSNLIRMNVVLLSTKRSISLCVGCQYLVNYVAISWDPCSKIPEFHHLSEISVVFFLSWIFMKFYNLQKNWRKTLFQLSLIFIFYEDFILWYEYKCKNHLKIFIKIHDGYQGTYVTVCLRNYWLPYGILLAALPLVAVLFISINNNVVTMKNSVLVDNPY